MNDHDRGLTELLRDVPIDGARDAEERSWRVVQAAYAERAAPARRRPRSWFLALAGAALALAVGFSPAGARVGEWIDELVGPGIENPQPALTRLPAPGNLLVTSAEGPWVIQPDGSRRLLGAYDEASWSPNGLFVIAARGRQLTALTPGGDVRWSLGAGRRVAGPRWAPSGYRVAYRSGHSLRVVAGDGAGDRLVAARVGSVAPAWKPLSGSALESSPTGVGTHLLAYSDPRGRVTLVDADSGGVSWRSDPGPVPTQLGWSGDGGLLFALQRSSVRVFDPTGFIGEIPAPIRGRLTSMAFSPVASSYALVATRSVPDGRARSEVVLVEAAGKGPISELFAGPGRFGAIAFSPDGRWLLVPWASADQWVFLPTDSASRRIEAVEEIARQFDPGGTGPAAFPRVEGWCC